MNFPKDEFWKLSRLKDKNGKYLYEDLRLISLSLEEYPLSGIGAAGGGFLRGHAARGDHPHRFLGVDAVRGADSAACATVAEQRPARSGAARANAMTA